MKLFDKTLSTVTPVRDSTNDDNGISSRYQCGQPLPLILSDSSHEDDMPVLILNDSDLSSNENKVRTLVFDGPDQLIQICSLYRNEHLNSCKAMRTVVVDP